MPNAFIRKLEGLQPLLADDRAWLMSILDRVKDVRADVDLISEGDNPEDVHLILDGFAVRYKMTIAGRRQIFAYMIAGDFCDLHIALLKTMDHSIRTLRPSRVVKISRVPYWRLQNGALRLPGHSGFAAWSMRLR